MPFAAPSRTTTTLPSFSCQRRMMPGADVAEGERPVAVVPQGAFGEDEAGGDLIDLDVGVYEVVEAAIERYDCHEGLFLTRAG